VRNTSAQPSFKKANDLISPGRLFLTTDSVLFIFLTILSFCLFFWRLGRGTLLDWDEAIYAQISKEIVHGGDWLTLHYGSRPWFEKPPLLMWLTAVLFKFFSINELWSRTVSAVGGVALVGVTFLLGNRVRHQLVGIASALVLLTSLQFVHHARFGTMDILLTFFVYLALYGYWASLEGSPNYWYLVCVSCGLAVMTKGAAGLLAPGLIGLLTLLEGRLRALMKQRFFWDGIAVALLIVAPWHVFMLLQNGRKFVDSYFFVQVLHRATTVLEDHPHDRWFYIGVLREGFYPWFYLAPMAIVVAFRQALKGDRRIRDLLLLILVVFGGYTVVRTGLSWYILPLYPALSILVGWLVIEAFESSDTTALCSLIFGGFLLTLLGPSKLVLIFCATGWLLLGATFLFFRNRVYRVLSAVTLTLFILVGLRNLRPLYYSSDNPVAKLSRLVGSAPRDDEEHFLVVPGSVSPSALYYSDLPIEKVEGTRTLTRIYRGKAMGAILPTADLPALAPSFRTSVLAEDGPFTLVVLDHPK
jgi:hypothetical protein